MCVWFWLWNHSCSHICISFNIFAFLSSLQVDLMKSLRVAVARSQYTVSILFTGSLLAVAVLAAPFWQTHLVPFFSLASTLGSFFWIDGCPPSKNTLNTHRYQHSSFLWSINNFKQEYFKHPSTLFFSLKHKSIQAIQWIHSCLWT